MKGPVLPENVLRFEDLPSTDSHGKPLARHAFVTLITQGGCDQDSFGYTAGAFALIESLQRTGTKLRIVVAMTNAVEKSAELAAQFMAVGAEPVMLEIIDHHGSGLNRLVSARHRHRQHAHAEGGGSATAAEYGGHRRLLERWKGMFSKLLLWAPWGALDKIVYLDTDHVVLHNIDHVVTMCAHSGICAVNDPTQNRMWDGNYVNAGMMVREHAGRTMVRAHRDTATPSPMIMHLGRVSAVAE
jgi:alpha-N-acetylglucosamine transferase